MNQAEEIKNRLDIVDVIRDYIPLKAAGANFKANCPFHREKSPSFMVSPEKQIYHCFGCGKGGDVLQFVMEMENLEFVDTLRFLAPKAGVVLKDLKGKNTSKKSRLLDLMDLASRYYFKSLTETESGKKMLQYLKDRGISQASIEYWRLGYSQNSWDDLLLFLLKKGYSEKEILQVGLITKKQSGRGYYNRFRDRIMFPISDINGNIIAFTGRVNPFDREASERGGKYINSPETELFNKSKVLYGLDKARSEIKKEDLAIVVEGQTDVILASQAGFKSVVASSGTALTKDQLLILKRYSENLALSFDMDSAGQMAADRGIVEALGLEMNIRVIVLPEGKDPAELILSKKELFSQAVKTAKPMMEYYLDKVLKEYDLSKIEDKRKATAKVMNMISKIANNVEKDHWLRQVAGSLDVSESVLREMTGKQARQSGATDKSVSDKVKNFTRTKELSRQEKLSNLLLALVLKFTDIFSYVSSELEGSELEDSLTKEFYNQLIIYYNKNSSLDFKGLERCWQEPKPLLLNRLRELVILGEKEFYSLATSEAKVEAISLISELKQLQKKSLRKNLEKEIADLERQGKAGEADKLLKKLQQLIF
ncbi:MAG: DNA primase [Candidatus Pacebacteria bacterium]|nr:DNA primase [Candidatus Paceibacterota bacterium]